MAKRRTTTSPATAEVPPAAQFAGPSGRFGTVDALAAVAALLCLVLGFLSRLALNPDGVSYLDLAGTVQRGDWTHFVQGYWSPLYPLVTGLISAATGLSGSALVPVTHAINLIAAIAGVGIIWRWTRAVAPTRPFFGHLAIAAFLLCSAGLPRIEAVTPDLLALLVAIWLSYELLARGGERWALVGLLLGVSFLVKTSAWPWLLAAVPLRLWGAADAPARRRVWWSSAICALVMLAWIVPMSVKAGAPTAGSSGRLNWSWYIDANTSRLPDGDRGVNSAYRDVPLGNGEQMTVATFDDAAPWTYQPWGDPTAWADKVMSDVGRQPTFAELAGYWARMFVRVFGLWLGPMIVATLLPAYLLHRRPAIWQELKTTQRNSLMVMLLGLVGLLQFVAVHGEPRLLAPYGILLAFGVIWWCTAMSPSPRPARVQLLLAWLGVATALGFAVPKFVEGAASNAHLIEATGKLDELKRRLGTAMSGTTPIGIVGPAAPVLSAAYWSGVHITMQIPPSSMDRLAKLPTNAQADLLISVFRGHVPLVWKTAADGSVEMLIVPNP